MNRIGLPSIKEAFAFGAVITLGARLLCHVAAPVSAESKATAETRTHPDPWNEADTAPLPRASAHARAPSTGHALLRPLR